MPLGTEVNLVPDDIVLDRDPALPLQKVAEPPHQFSAHVYWTQTTGWIMMALGTEIGLNPGDVVLHGDPAPPPIMGHTPNFRPMSVVGCG